MTHSTPENPQDERPPVETRTDLRIVRLSTAILVVIVIIGLFLMHELVGLLKWSEPTTGPLPASELSQRAAMREPDLNPDQPAQLAKLRAESEKTLTTYAWVDRENKVARIPVERAMELLLKQGLPVREQPPAETSK